MGVEMDGMGWEGKARRELQIGAGCCRGRFHLRGRGVEGCFGCAKCDVQVSMQAFGISLVSVLIGFAALSSAMSAVRTTFCHILVPARPAPMNPVY